MEVTKERLSSWWKAARRMNVSRTAYHDRSIRCFGDGERRGMGNLKGKRGGKEGGGGEWEREKMK